MEGTTRWLRLSTVFIALALLASCAPAPDGSGFPPSTRPPSEAEADATPVIEDRSCPSEPVAPAADRPIVTLEFSLAENLSIVSGFETVVFTPDLATDELVFRLTPNSPASGPFGNLLTVSEVTGKQVSGFDYETAGAFNRAPGGLLVVELKDELEAGDSVEVSLEFELELGDGTFDRFGTAEGVSWWASGFPLLAWEPGVGWDREPLLSLLGETSTSEAADTTISVEAPEDLVVLMTGAQDRPTNARNGRRIWTSSEPAARDVSVAAGNFDTSQALAGDTEITVGVLPDADADGKDLAESAASIIEDLEKYFGPFPFDTLSIPLLPDFGGGIEYPSSILLAGESRGILVHEIAHMWFYGMVGNSQYRDPWLDESFASYAEQLTDDPEPDTSDLAEPGDIGASMGEFRTTDEYLSVVYGKGRAALATARAAAGGDAFDAALRCYLNAQAWQIAVPDDVAAVLVDLPEALAVLDEAGAFL